MTDDKIDIFVANSVHPDAAALFDASYKSVGEILDECDVVLDTNVLLTPYTTGKSSLDQLRAVYGRLKAEGRLHVPGQVAREYTRWRARKLTDLYQRLADYKGKATTPAGESFPILEDTKTYGALQAAQVALNEAVSAYRIAVDDVLREIRDWSLEDPVTKLYKDVVGGAVVREHEFDPSTFREDLDRRFLHRIPPGYKDASKTDSGVGDLLIWRTILDIGAERKRHLIFVTGEEKADWQHRADNRGLFPRLELVDEYRRASGGETFHLVTLSRLLELFDADTDVVAEVREQEAVARERFRYEIPCPFCGTEVSCFFRKVPGASAKPHCPECGEWFHAHWREGEDPLVRRPREAGEAGPPQVDERASCPQCHSDRIVRIAEDAGSSAISHCGECESRFHVHRRRDGSVFARPWGGDVTEEESGDEQT
jgi:transcription elongation factor Elf1